VKIARVPYLTAANVEHAIGVTTMMTGYNLEDVAKNIDSCSERQPMGVFACQQPRKSSSSRMSRRL
jgi:hypothetical protein